MLKKYLKSFLDIAPYLGTLMDEDISIGVMDSKSFILAQGGIRLKSTQKAGDKNTYDDFTLSILKNKKSLTIINPPGHHDIPAKVTLTPVLDDNGESTDIMIALVRNIEQQVKVDELARDILESFEQINKGTETIADDSQKLSSYISEIVAYTDETQREISEIDNVIKVIKNIATQSNLLAINAKIEAARAGESGKGFSVVASEMGKMAQLSKESANQVTQSLTAMKNAIKTITERIEKIGASSENQAAATEEISATVNNVFHSFEKLTDVAKVI